MKALWELVVWWLGHHFGGPPAGYVEACMAGEY